MPFDSDRPKPVDINSGETPRRPGIRISRRSLLRGALATGVIALFPGASALGRALDIPQDQPLPRTAETTPTVTINPNVVKTIEDDSSKVVEAKDHGMVFVKGDHPLRYEYYTDQYLAELDSRDAPKSSADIVLMTIDRRSLPVVDANRFRNLPPSAVQSGTLIRPIGPQSDPSFNGMVVLRVDPNR